MPLLYVVLTHAGFADPVQAATYLVGVSIISHIVSFGTQYILMRKSLSLKIAWISIGKYSFAAIVAGFALLVLPYTTTITATFGKMLVGAGIYAGLLYAIDADARKLVRQIWEEISSALRPNLDLANS